MEEDGRTALAVERRANVVLELANAVKNKNLALAKRIILAYPDYDYSGVLSLAIFSTKKRWEANLTDNPLEMIELLLTAPGIRRTVNVTNNEGKSPLQEAAGLDLTDFPRILLIFMAVDGINGVSAMLPYVIYRYLLDLGYREILEILLQREDVDLNAKIDLGKHRGDTSLHMTLRSEKLWPIAKRLMSLPLINLACVNSAGETPLHIAAQSGATIFVHKLLSSPVVLANAQDRLGRTPIMHCKLGDWVWTGISPFRVLYNHPGVIYNLPGSAFSNAPSNAPSSAPIISLRTNPTDPSFDFFVWYERVLIRYALHGYLQLARVTMTTSSFEFILNNLPPNKTYIIDLRRATDFLFEGSSACASLIKYIKSNYRLVVVLSDNNDIFPRHLIDAALQVNIQFFEKRRNLLMAYLRHHLPIGTPPEVFANIGSFARPNEFALPNPGVGIVKSAYQYIYDNI
jgi:ankyrin repeat protein